MYAGAVEHISVYNKWNKYYFVMYFHFVMYIIIPDTVDYVPVAVDFSFWMALFSLAT